MKRTLSCLSILISLVLLVSCFAAFAAFANLAESITYTAYGENNTALYTSDYTLKNQTENIFLSADCKKVNLKVTAQNNALPNYTVGGNELSFEESALQTVEFSVLNESYKIFFIKEVEENAIITDIKIKIGEEKTDIGFNFTPFTFNRKAEISPSANKAFFEIEAEGAALLINGEEIKESYEISGEKTSFAISATKGEITYVYNIELEKSSLLESESLRINREQNHLSNIKIGMSVQALKESFLNNPSDIKVYKNGEEVTSGSVSTGMQVVLVGSNGAELDKLTTVVYGDISSDGRVNAADILAIIINNETENLKNEKKKAADVNGDGRINAADILSIIIYNEGGKIKQDR